MKRINVYTDGACSNNGRPNAKAGLGVYFGENDARNKYARITGKQTNNRAEVMAILTAANILYREILAGYDIHIYSDSTYAMRCCGEYGEKLHSKNWASKKPIPNLELVKTAYETFKKYDNITFHYIAAHTGLDDEHSRGNEGADRLANLAIGQTSCQYANKSKKKSHYAVARGRQMGVFNSWDECKVQVDGFLDARYKGFTSLAEAEAWIALNSTDNVIPGHQALNKPKKIYLNVPYSEKDEGKKLGTKWDPKKKKWYIFSNSNNKETILNRWPNI